VPFDRHRGASVDELWASVIAVAGTLLGGALTYFLQERGTRRRDDAVRAAEVRREMRAVCGAFLGALTAMRQHQFHRYGLRVAGAPEVERAAAERRALEARTAVTEALAALQLCTDDQAVLDHATRAVDVAFTLHRAADPEDMDHRAADARGAHDAFVAVARTLTRA
jgi:hypothetical protein